MYAQVALPINQPENFVYRVPPNLNPIKGARVVVPFQYQTLTGVVVKLKQKTDLPAQKIKKIKEVLEEKPIFDEQLFNLAIWISNYYQCPLGLVFKAMLPAGSDIRTIRKIELTKAEAKNNDHGKIVSLIKNSGNEMDFKKLLAKNITSPYKEILEMEEEGIIEIEREYRRKIRKKTLNYLKLTENEDDVDLTRRQQELYNFLKEERLVAVKDISDEFSYSLIKKIEEKGLGEVIKKEIVEDRFAINTNKIVPEEFDLTTEQINVINEIKSNIKKELFGVYLLHGVTASGKTEVYIRSMKETLKSGKTAILLIPEIALTPQTVERFYSHFGDSIAVLHSKQSDRTRYNNWNEIRKGNKKIVIGPRSAIFAPLKNVGLLIVDEEHENSYKQQGRKPMYNGRDMAVLRGKLSEATVVLGSATPSLESYYNVETGKYNLLEMKKKVKNEKLPEFYIIDMREVEDNHEIFSPMLRDEIEQRLKKNEQVILFQNRRGYASYVQCVNCGYVFQCNDCNISQTYHHKDKSIVCHYCGKKAPAPRKCPECGGVIFNFGSPGTEKIEKSLEYIFPQATIARMDRDTTVRKNSHQLIYDRVKNGKIDILLGTQMIIKGLDFPNVTLVGIVSADVNLNLPDFRAAERNFQHVTQVAGRTGRSKKKGEVVVQTYNPEHYSILFGKDRDYEGFYNYETRLRDKLNYPPNFKLARILFSAKKEDSLKEFAKRIRSRLRKNNLKRLIVMGPVAAPLNKIKKRYRYHIIIKSSSQNRIANFIKWFEDTVIVPNYIRCSIDIDPISLM